MKFSKNSIKNLVVVSIIVSIYFAIVYRFSNLESNLIQNFILRTEAPLYLLTFILFLSLLFLYHKQILKSFGGMKKNDWFCILTIFIFAFIVRELVPPKTTRLFFDEDIYLDMAKQITKQLSSCLCNYGNKFKCFKCELMKWPVGHPFLLSIPFFFFGSSDVVASHFMIFLSSLSTVFVFLSSYLLFKNKKIAIFSSLVLAILPVHILWSVTSSADVTFSFFTSLAIFFSILSAKTNDLKIHVISLIALALSVQAKTESVILIPLYFLTQALLNSNYLGMYEKKSYLLAIIFSFSIIFVYLVHTLYAGRVDPWGSSGEKFGFGYLRSNFMKNLGYWFEVPAIEDKWSYTGKQLYHPFLLSVVACVGLPLLLKNSLKKFLMLLCWFGALFLMYASFYAGSVYYGVDVRYVLPQYIPFSLICGFGFYSILNFMEKLVNEKKVFIFLIALLLFYFSTYLQKMHIPQEKIEESYGARLYRNSVIDFASKQPDDCYFISHVSSIYSWLGKGHIQVWYVYRPEFDSILRDNNCVIFDEGYWCAIQVPESQSCIEFGKKYKLELLKRVNDTKENKVYSLYKIILA